MTEHQPERNLGQRVGIAVALAIAAVIFLAGLVGARPPASGCIAIAGAGCRTR